ncbi:MAG: hypothetical protein R3Y12_08205 [Clostridia bacterium]
MKKFALPILANIVAFVGVPVACSFLESETLKEIWVLILVIGNSAYFFVQSNLFARKYKNLVELFVINVATILLYMFFYIGQISLTFLIFYTVMIMLGMRDGNNRLKFKENLKILLESQEQQDDDEIK